MKRVLKNMAFIFILFILSYADVYAYEIKNNSVFSKEHVVAVIRKNQIWAIDVNNEKNKVLVDKGGKFSYPLISSTGYIAYRKNNDLYVSRIDFKNKSATYKVTDDVLSYIWHSNGSLLYSKDSGGLYVKDVKNNKNKILRLGKESYAKIVEGKDGIIFAEKNGIKNINGHDYQNELGIVKMNLKNNDEILIVERKPGDYVTGDLGLNPKIASVSYDGINLFIWCKPNSESASADGVELGVYNVNTGIFSRISGSKIISLVYTDNIAISPVNNNEVAIVNGHIRDMNLNKSLDVIDLSKKKIKKISPIDETIMTPYYSHDGKRILYSSALSSDSIIRWQNNMNHNIFEYDIEKSKIEKLTDKKGYWDFAPRYVNDGQDIVFLRKSRDGKLSLIIKKKNCERTVVKGILNNSNLWYYGHYDLGRVTTL